MTAEAHSQQWAGESPADLRVPLLADTPLTDPALDRFGFAAFANALALVVDHERTATPLTVAISAPWGGGKTSVGAMAHTLIQQRVANRRGDDPRLICWFNAWEHEDASHLGAALAAAVAREAARHRTWWRRAVAPLPSAMLDPGERLRRTSMLALFSLAASAALALAQPTRSLAQDLVGTDELSVSAPGVLGVVTIAMLLFQRIFTTAKNAAGFIDDPRSEATRGTMAEVKRQLGKLIRHATRNGRLVIFIDDLDRCESARALEVCRVASQLLAQEGVVTVLLADMTPIAASAAAQYPFDREEAGGSDAAMPTDDVGRRYLEKITQLELVLPPPVPADMREVTSGYGAVLRGTTTSRVRSGILRRWWESARRQVPELRRRGDRMWRALKHAAERTGWWPPAIWFSALIAYRMLYPSAPEEDMPNWQAIPLFTLLGISVWSMVLRRERRERRETYKRKIEELKEDGALSPQEIEAKVIGDAQPAQLTAERDLISDLVSSSFLDSAEFRAVEHYVADHPARLPRESKRTFNHAQLLTEIARARQMFGGEPTLMPEHLAKWVVLRERWPGIGRATLLDVGVLVRLEDAASAGRLPQELAASNVKLHDVPALNALLREQPRLAEFVERLIHFKPAAATVDQDNPLAANRPPHAETAV